MPCAGCDTQHPFVRSIRRSFDVGRPKLVQCIDQKCAPCSFCWTKSDGHSQFLCLNLHDLMLYTLLTRHYKQDDVFQLDAMKIVVYYHSFPLFFQIGLSSHHFRNE